MESKSEETVAPEPDFNLDEFLKFDSIPEVLTVSMAMFTLNIIFPKKQYK